MSRKGVFISYSHKDKKWLDIILTFLKPYIREEKITVWSDKEIKPGSSWKKEILEKINNCRVAILLVSPNFLASDFIFKEELSLILKKSNQKELIIYWIAVSHSAYKNTELANIQSANDPSKPLDSLSPTQRNKILVEIADKIVNAININAIGNVLKIIDDFVPEQKAFVEKTKLDKRPRNYSIQANQENDEIKLRDRENKIIETITADDLKKLDKQSKTLITSYENSMQDLFERWSELQPKSISRNEIIRKDARNEMSRIRKDLCRQLNELLNYLTFLGKRLDDHYHHVRFICTQRIK